MDLQLIHTQAVFLIASSASFEKEDFLMKKLISLMLALVLICSLIPLTAFAAFNPVQYEKVMIIEGKWYGYNNGDDGWIDIDAEMKEYLSQLDDDDDDGDVYLPHSTEDKIIGYGSDTKYHWKQCSCGCKIGMERHVDPKDATNDYCICGYHFSSNADLVTLWVKGCPGIKYFDKNKTEYELDAYTYKDIKEIKISTRTHDSEATVELPEDLTLKEGQNKFEVKVTSENQKVTKVYTLIINKEAKK